MKQNKIKALSLIVACLCLFSTELYSQTIYRITNSKDIDMKLSGTSTLHKWEMEAKTFTGEAQFNFNSESDTVLTGIKALTFSLVVQNLKSDEKKLDKNAYKALKTDRYKDIAYKLISATVLRDTGIRCLMITRGNLTIAGVTKVVTMNVYCTVNKDGTVTCTGSHKLKMTDYKVKPPSFMLGAMKTGDDIALDFILVYKKQSGL